MQEINIIASQIAVLMLLTAIGYLAGKTGYLPGNAGEYLSKVVIRITAPSLIISTMTSYNFDEKTLRDGLWVGFYAIVFMLLALLPGALFSRLLSLEGASANVFKAHTVFGNASYLALPLFKVLLGDKAVVTAVFFILSFELLMWTLGVYLLNKHKELTFSGIIKKFINLNTITCILGLIFALTNIQRFIKGNAAAEMIYDIFYRTFNPLGNCTLPLVMLFVGLTAANSTERLSSILKKRVTLMLAFLKLLLVPLFSLIILLLMGDLVDPFVRTIVVLELAMPCSTLVVALSAEYGSDYKLAGDNTIITTVLSLVTLPLIMMLLNFI